MSYAREKLIHECIPGLATGAGRIKERLAKMYTSSFQILEVEDFPKELRSEFKEIHHLLTRVDAEFPEEGRVHASVRALSEDGAVMVAHRIIGLADQLEE